MSLILQYDGVLPRGEEEKEGMDTWKELGSESESNFYMPPHIQQHPRNKKNNNKITASSSLCCSSRWWCGQRERQLQLQLQNSDVKLGIGIG